MFVKKDLRKIPIILQDAMMIKQPPDGGGDDSEQKQNQEQKQLTELRLARRPTEFKHGTIHDVLCQPKYIPAMTNLVSISLYDCQIRSIDGIGFFATPIKYLINNRTRDNNGDDDDDDDDVSMDDNGDSKSSTGNSEVVCPNLQELNLGRNPIKTLPSELRLLSKSLKSLWLDDCEIEGPLPECIYALDNLEILRLSNNQITELKDGRDDYGKDDDDELMEDVGGGGSSGSLGVCWKKMKVLCLDGNSIESVPKWFVHLTNLKSLLLRKNKIKSLPEGVPGSTHTKLTMFHVSSNELKTLPQSLKHCDSLETIYANGNQIENIPDDVFSVNSLPNLKIVNMSNNQIQALSTSFLDRFGMPNNDFICVKDDNCKMILEQNQLLSKNAVDDKNQDKMDD